MKIEPGNTAVVTGAGSGIGLALAEAFARRGMNLVLADVQDDALTAAEGRIRAHGVQTLAVKTDVSKEPSVQALAAAAVARFGRIHVVCNNAGVSGGGDAWTGPFAAWEWVIGVNLFGVVHGIRAFLPHLVKGGGGHIVNTASIAGLRPGFGPAYDASKHGVIALSEDLFNTMRTGGLPVGVSLLCPGWVRTGILDADRNWPSELGERGLDDAVVQIMRAHVRRAIDEATPPAAVADAVLEAVESDRFWILPHDNFLSLAVKRWKRIAEKLNPEPDEHVPGLPPRSQVMAEIKKLLDRDTR